MAPRRVLGDLLVFTGVKIHKVPHTQWLYDMLFQLLYLRPTKGNTLSQWHFFPKNLYSAFWIWEWIIDERLCCLNQGCMSPKSWQLFGIATYLLKQYKFSLFILSTTLCCYLFSKKIRNLFSVCQLSSMTMMLSNLVLSRAPLEGRYYGFHIWDCLIRSYFGNPQYQHGGGRWLDSVKFQQGFWDLLLSLVKFKTLDSDWPIG